MKAFLQVSEKLFIIIVKIASVLHLVVSLIPVDPSSPSKLKPLGTISSAEDKNFCAPKCSGSKIFAQPIVQGDKTNLGARWLVLSQRHHILWLVKLEKLPRTMNMDIHSVCTELCIYGKTL